MIYNPFSNTELRKAIDNLEAEVEAKNIIIDNFRQLAVGYKSQSDEFQRKYIESKDKFDVILNIIKDMGDIE